MKISLKTSLPAIHINISEQVRTIFMALIMCAFFKPAHYIIGTSLNKVWKLYTLIVCIIGFIYFLLKKRKFNKKDSAIFLIIAGYAVCYVLSTFFNYQNGNFFDALQNTIETIGYLSVVSIAILYNQRVFFKGYLVAGVFWTFLHLCTILIYQDGGMRSGRNLDMARSYSENWFLLTHANASYFIILPVVAVLFIYAYSYCPKLKIAAWAYLLFSIFCFYTQWSVAGLIGLTIFTVFMVLETLLHKIVIDNRKLSKRKASLKLYIGLYAIMNILLTFGGLLENSIQLFYKYFNKMHSLQARVTIWNRCIQLFENRFLIGFGWERDEITIAKTTYNHMHNIMLEIIYRGGIIGLILFCAGLYIALFCGKSKSFKGSVEYRILSYVTIAFLISSSFDFYLYRYEILVIAVMFLYLKNHQKVLSVT